MISYVSFFHWKPLRIVRLTSDKKISSVNATLRFFVGCLLLIAYSLIAPSVSLAQQRHLIIVVGAPGETEYREIFGQWTQRWIDAAIAAGNSHTVIGMSGSTSATEDKDTAIDDRTRLQEAISEWKSGVGGDRQLWLVLIGHGTFDQKTAKFNLVGSDFSASELKSWLNSDVASGVSSTPKIVDQIVINCSSSSSPFLNELSAPNRIVIAATESGMQFNFTRFGDYLSQQVLSSNIDLDKDKRTSLLEMVLAASVATQEFYKSENRLATESATIEDNADGLGTPAQWFAGIRVVKSAKDNEPDGLRSNQVFFGPAPDQDVLSTTRRQERDRLEAAIEDLRRMKESLKEDLYFQRLEDLALKLARLHSDNAGK